MTSLHGSETTALFHEQPWSAILKGDRSNIPALKDDQLVSLRRSSAVALTANVRVSGSGGLVRTPVPDTSRTANSMRRAVRKWAGVAENMSSQRFGEILEGADIRMRSSILDVAIDQ